MNYFELNINQEKRLIIYMYINYSLSILFIFLNTQKIIIIITNNMNVITLYIFNTYGYEIIYLIYFIYIGMVIDKIIFYYLT